MKKQILLPTLLAVLISTISSAFAKKNDQHILNYEQAVTYSKKCFDLGVSLQTDSAIYYGEQAINYFSEFDEYKKDLGLAYFRIGIAHSSALNYKTSIPFTDSAIHYFALVKDTTMNGYALRNQGVNYHFTGQESVAIQYYFKSLKIFEALKHDGYLGMINVNLGNLYAHLEGLTEAEEYYTKAINHLELCNCAPNELSNAYNGLGNVTSDNNKDAHEHYNKALSYFKSNNDRSGYAIVLNNIGKNFLTVRSKQDSAKHYFNRARTIAESEELDYALSGIYINIGSIHSEEGNFDSAKINIERGIQLAEHFNQSEILRNGLNELVELNRKTAKYQDALAAKDSAYQVNEKILGKEQLISAKLEQVRHNVDQLKAENDYLKNKQELSAALIKQKENRNVILLISLLLVLTLLVVISLNRKKLKKSKIELEQSKQSLQKNHEALKKLHTFQESILSVIGHDLRGYLASNASLIQLLNPKIKQNELLDMLETSNTAALEILSDLVNWSRSSQTNELQHTAINLQESIQNSVNQTIIFFENKQIHLSINVHPYLRVLASDKALDVIMRNLLTNACKFTPRNKCVTVNCIELENSQVEVQVCNEGEPISESLIENILSGNNIVGIGTNNEKGLGIGLQMVIFMLNFLDSTLQITNSPTGPCVSFKLKTEK